MPFEALTLRRVLRAPPDRVFAAWTRPELMAKWFFSRPGWTTLAAADVREGGRFDIAMRSPEGETHEQFGVYREVVPVSRLVFTWNFPELGVVDSVVTITLTPIDGQTELRLEHELSASAEIVQGHQAGWAGCLGNLASYLEA